MLELHRKIRGTLGNKEVLAMMEMNGKEANNSPFQKKPKAMWCHKKHRQWETDTFKNRNKNHLSKRKIIKTCLGIKVDILTMLVMLQVRKVARSSGAAEVAKDKKKIKDPKNSISQNKLKIMIGKRTRNLRSNSFRTINSILRIHHMVRTKTIECKIKGNKIDMTTQQTCHKINIKMRHNKMVQDLLQDPALSLLWSIQETLLVENHQSLSEQSREIITEL